MWLYASFTRITLHYVAYTFFWQVGSWHSTEIPSCDIHLLFVDFLTSLYAKKRRTTSQKGHWKYQDLSVVTKITDEHVYAQHTTSFSQFLFYFQNKKSV